MWQNSTTPGLPSLNGGRCHRAGLAPCPHLSVKALDRATSLGLLLPQKLWGSGHDPDPLCTELMGSQFSVSLEKLKV